MSNKSCDYALAPCLCLEQIGDQYYLYDSGLGSRRLLRHATKPISESDAKLIRALADADLPAPLDLILNRIDSSEACTADLQAMIERGILVANQSPDDTLSEQSFARGVYVDRFLQRDLARRIERETFFDVPPDADRLKPSVALKGVPLASVSKNKGVEAAPDYLRHVSSTLANWFEIHLDGVFSDFCLGRGAPTIGQGLVMADFGDLDFKGDELTKVFTKIRQCVDSEFVDAGVKPLFVGGDHAITFPIVEALHSHLPDIGVLHLDAHHDLFFGDQIQYSHASVVTNLLFHTGVEAVYSFGLRARADLVGQAACDLLRLPHGKEWWRRASTITDTRRYIMSPALIDDLLEQDRRRPFYLTIDLDVLSPEAISGRVMTPVPDGLSWSELFALLEMLFERLNIVGCDVTELNPYRGTANADTEEGLGLLLIYLIEKLGR